MRCFAHGPSSLLLGWQPLAAAAMNGLPTGHRVRVRPLGGDPGAVRTVNTSVAQTELLLSQLAKFTNYSMQVFAVNRKG